MMWKKKRRSFAFCFFFTIFDQMSRVGSRCGHTWCRQKKIRIDLFWRPWGYELRCNFLFGYFEYDMCPECKQKSIITTYDMQKEKYSTSALWSIFLTTKASLMQKIQLLFGNLEAVNFLMKNRGKWYEIITLYSAKYILKKVQSHLKSAWWLGTFLFYFFLNTLHPTHIYTAKIDTILSKSPGPSQLLLYKL